MIVVVAIIGIFASLAAPNLRRPPARLAADAVASVVQQGRFEAIKTNRPMVVTFANDGDAVELHRTSNATSVSCDLAAATISRSESVGKEFGASLIASETSIVWLPSGQLRGCSGRTLYEDVWVDLSTARSTARLLVTPGGEVRIE